LFSLDYNSLLQANATVIAGILILLTIYSLKPRRSPESRREVRINQGIASVIISVIVPFCASSIMIITNQELGLAAPVAVLGFVYLIFGIIVIVLMPTIRFPEKTQTGKP
jgi:peptidoglycan biosynthesis protein MviN/MurJ (putative lipid II flippase)